MSGKIYLKLKIIYFLVLFFSLGTAMAQDTSAAKKKGHFLVQPYLMFPNMNGTSGIANLPDASVDLSASDIFSHLHLGAMLYVEATIDKWAISSDILYMNLKEDVSPGILIASGEVTMKQVGWEVAGLRKVQPWLEVGAGLRLNNINAELDLNIKQISGGTVNSKKNLTQTWVDPVLITRAKLPLSNKFLLQFRGDLGGFGIGSDFTWQIQVDAAYNFSKKFLMALGYRIISVDYNKGSGQERFLYDMNTFGPALKFGFNL